MRGECLELGTTLGWDRSQMHKSIPKISQLWGGVVLYNLAKKVFGLGLVDYPVSHQTFCLFLCFVPIPSYLTFCPNSFLQLSVFFLFNWSDQVPILQRRIVSIFCKQNLDLSYFLLRSINFVTKNVHILPHGVVWRQSKIFVLFFENEQHPVYPLTRKKDQQTMLFLLFNPCYWN